MINIFIGDKIMDFYPVWVVERQLDKPGGKVMQFGAEPDTFSEGEIFQSPTFRLTDAELSALAENLWRLGFKPRERIIQGDVIAAKDKHIADLQTLLFNFKVERANDN